MRDPCGNALGDPQKGSKTDPPIEKKCKTQPNHPGIFSKNAKTRTLTPKIDFSALWDPYFPHKRPYGPI